MRRAAPTEAEARVLVLAPLGRDAEVTCEALRAGGIGARACRDLGELRRELAAGAAALVVAVEALAGGEAVTFTAALRAQEPWSDLPVVLATAAGRAADARHWAVEALGTAGAVTVLERPIRLPTLLSAVTSAVRVRERQYEMRDLLEELRVTVERLDAERVVRERFVSLLAHDLRGPLSAARLGARLLSLRPESLDARRDVALRIERNVERADRMIRDLLDANRLRAGHRLPLDLQRCDVVEVASDVVADLEDDARARVATSAPDRLEGIWSPDELRRSLWNLVTNALKYGAPAAPVTIEIRRVDESAMVSVHNEGEPIPAEEQPRLFEPFGRARKAEAGRVRGWGLGLTLVRGCVEAHGGRLELSSTAEGGTTFAMWLPLDARPFAAGEPETR
jgi:signal transduction histidine kinase